MMHSDAEDPTSLRSSMDGNLLKDWHILSFNQTLEQLLQSRVCVLQGSTRQSSSSNSSSLGRKYYNFYLFKNNFKKESSLY